MVIRLSILLLSLSGLVQAQALPDPTRPPISESATVPIEVPSGPTLQLIRTLDGKRMAMISGQAVTVGAKVGDARVVRIDEDRVVLRGPGGTQTLKLFPDVEKNVAQTGSKPPLKSKMRKDHGKKALGE